MDTDPLPQTDLDQVLAELRRDIGTATPWRSFRVTEADVARFSAAVDPGARLPFPPPVAQEPPPTFFCPDPIILSQRLGLERRRPFPNTLDGGSRWEWLAPLPVGATARLRAEVVDVERKAGSPATGVMFLTTILVTCAATTGETIARCWGTSISYEGSGS